MKSTIATLIRNNSYDQVHRMFLNGQIGQLHFEAYSRVWEWIAPRFGGLPGWKQDRLWAKSRIAYARKVNKTRAAFGFEPINFPLQ